MKINLQNSVNRVGCEGFRGVGNFTMLFAILLMISFGSANVQAATYYVDSGSSGNDKNSGLVGFPWKTLSKVSSVVFEPGDQILFKAGCSWTGQLICRGVGSAESPIIVDMYGTGNKPVLNGTGVPPTIHQVSATIYFENKSCVGFKASPYGYWEINNLEITNNSANRKDVSGIFVSNNNGGKIEHLYFRNLYIHDISGMDPGNGGIIFACWGTPATPAHTATFNDVRIEYCSLYNIGGSGIIVSRSTLCDRHVNDEFNPSTNVIIRNNYLDKIGQDGIIAHSTQDALVEYNVANECASKSDDAHVAMWPFASQDAVFQYNEVSNTVIKGPNSYDSQAYDCDFNCDGTIFQYNYSHNNAGGFMLICCNGGNLNKFNENPIVRYNVSENDGRDIIRVSGQTYNAQVYNNTIYIGGAFTGNKRIFYQKENANQYPDCTSYKNNIIYNLGSGKYINESATNTTYDYNCFYGNHPDSEPAAIVRGKLTHKMTHDPMLVNPGRGGSIVPMPASMRDLSVYPETNMSNPNRLPSYKLQAGSPCINAGVSIPDNGGKDFWGTPLYNGAPDIGACEYTTSAAPLVFETENLFSTFSTGRSRNKTINPSCSGGAFSRDNLNNCTTSYVEYTVPVAQAGTYNVKVKYVLNDSRGIWQLKVNGVNQGATVDGFSDSISYQEVNLGNVNLSAGKNLFRFQAAGRNSLSSNYWVCTDAIILTRP